MKALLDLRTFEIIWLEDDEGRRWRVEGYLRDQDGHWRCDTSGCQAACCVKGDQYCEHLGPGFECQHHATGACFLKPAVCLFWPKSQLDLDSEPACKLRLVPYEDD